jgi:predicted DNA-binding mobile mystery protein A
MTNVQLANRLGKVPQSVEDMQKSEMAGSIKLQSLRSLAEALDCQLVYALVPRKPLVEMRQEQARAVARVMDGIYGAAHDQRARTGTAGEKQLERLIKKVLAGNPKVLRK